MRRFGQPRAGRPLAGVGAALAGGLVVALAARMRFERALAAERSARVRADLLGRAGRLLAAPLDPEVRLQELTALAIPDIADVCSPDPLRDDGPLELTAVAAADPAIAAAVRDSRGRWPIDPAGTHPVAVAARTGEPQLVSDITPQHLRDVAQAEGHRDRMTRIGYRSGIAVPLAARGRTLGALALMRTEGELYDELDRDLAAELARRAALAVDNARLFAELTTTERQLEAVLTNLGEAVTVQGPDYGLVYANQAAATLLECASPDELLRTPMAEVLGRFVVLDEQGLPLDIATLPGRAALAGETPDPVLVRYISRATGEEHWMLVKATPVRGDDRRVGPAAGARGAHAARGGRPPGGHRGGERARARRADDDRHHAAAQPAAPAAADRAGRDDRRALPRGGRGERRGRRLLRPVPARRRLDGGHRRRHRQGPRGRGDHLAGPLHDAHGGGVRALAGGRAGPAQPRAGRRPRPPPPVHGGVRADRHPARRPRRRGRGLRPPPAAVRPARRPRRGGGPPRPAARRLRPPGLRRFDAAPGAHRGRLRGRRADDRRRAGPRAAGHVGRVRRRAA